MMIFLCILLYLVIGFGLSIAYAYYDRKTRIMTDYHTLVLLVIMWPIMIVLLPLEYIWDRIYENHY